MRKETKRWIRSVGRLLFVLYMGLLVYFLFFAESYGRAGDITREYRYNLKLFAEIKSFWIYREKVGTLAMVIKAENSDLEILAELAVLMWQNHSVNVRIEEFSEIMMNGESQFFFEV